MSNEKHNEPNSNVRIMDFACRCDDIFTLCILPLSYTVFVHIPVDLTQLDG